MSRTRFASQPTGLGALVAKSGSTPAGGSLGTSPAGSSKQPKRRVGETKVVNGVTYRLNSGHRWELAEHDDPEQAHAAQPIQPGDVDRAQQAVEVDHKQRADFVGQQLGQVDPKVGGLMRAMQAAPAFQKGAEYATKDVHPKQAGELHAFLQENIGQTVGGGEVRDLGNGNLGFSSAAGAIAVSAPGADGRHRVHYTAKTGVVDRAMQGGSSGQQAAGIPAESPIPAGGQTQPELQSAPTAITTPTAAPAASGDANHAVDGPVLASESDDASQLRLSAESAHADYANAVADWEKAAKNTEQGGKAGWFKENGKWVKKSIPTVADRKVLAQHRSKVASLRTIWKDKQSAFDQHGKRQAAAAKQAAKSQGKAAKGKAPADVGDATPDEVELMHKTGLSLEQARRMLEPAKPATRKPRTTAPKVQQAMQAAAAALGIALGGQGAGSPEAKASEPDKQARLADDEWETPEGGGGPIPEAKRAWVPGKERWKQDLHRHIESHGLQNHPDNLAAVQRAVDNGDIENHEQLTRVLARAKKLHERGNVADRDTPALKESLRRRKNRAERGPRQNYDEHVKQAAHDFGMDEDMMRSFVDQVRSERKSHHLERESAKAHARKAAGLTAADINRLENQGLDSGSAHEKTAKLDTVGRELASQYPSLGWGRGADDDGISNVDYGEQLWNLIREGDNPPPSNTSEEFWDEVSKFINSQAGGGSSVKTSLTDEEREALDSVPFARWQDAETVRLRYRAWKYAKRAKSSPGQRDMFDDAAPPNPDFNRKHPRDDDGQFTEADAISAAVAQDKLHQEHPILAAESGPEKPADDAGDDKPQTDLLGQPYVPPKPEAKPEEPQPKAKQVPLFSTAGSPGQMNAFDNVGVPDDMVVGGKNLPAIDDAAEPTTEEWNQVFDETLKATGREWDDLIGELEAIDGRQAQIDRMNDLSATSEGSAASWEPEDDMALENFVTGDWETAEDAAERRAWWESRLKARTTFRDSLKEADIPNKKKGEYLKTVQYVLARMPMAAIESLNKNVSKVQWYGSAPDLTKKLAPGTEAGKCVGGCWSSGYDGTGTLHLDGDTGGNLNAKGVYSHEFGHVADWNENIKPGRYGDRSISLQPEWHEAFIDELKGGQLSKYGASSLSEGFAEFARYVWNEPGRRKDKEAEFPKCYAVFRKYGLV